MLSGMGISDGIGIGNAVILNDEDIKIEKIKIDNIEQEKKVFFNAVKAVQNETEELISYVEVTETPVEAASEVASTEVTEENQIEVNE